MDRVEFNVEIQKQESNNVVFGSAKYWRLEFGGYLAFVWPACLVHTTQEDRPLNVSVSFLFSFVPVSEGPPAYVVDA